MGRFALKFKTTGEADKFKAEFDDVIKASYVSEAVAYTIIRKVGVTAESSLPSRHVKLLHVGETVNVVEVAYSEETKRVRARLAQPQGWVTVLSHDASDAASYAVPSKDLQNYSASKS